MPRLAVGELRPCTACGKSILGALTVNGKVAPIEVEPHADGNVWLGSSVPVLLTEDQGWVRADEYQPELDGPVDTPRRVPRASTLAGDHLAHARQQGMALHHNHYAACPHADRFRRPQPGGTPT